MPSPAGTHLRSHSLASNPALDPIHAAFDAFVGYSLLEPHVFGGNPTQDPTCFPPDPTHNDLTHIPTHAAFHAIAVWCRLPQRREAMSLDQVHAAWAGWLLQAQLLWHRVPQVHGDHTFPGLCQ